VVAAAPEPVVAEPEPEVEEPEVEETEEEEEEDVGTQVISGARGVNPRAKEVLAGQGQEMFMSGDFDDDTPKVGFFQNLKNLFSKKEEEVEPVVQVSSRLDTTGGRGVVCALRGQPSRWPRSSESAPFPLLCELARRRALDTVSIPREFFLGSACVQHPLRKRLPPPPGLVASDQSDSSHPTVNCSERAPEWKTLVFITIAWGACGSARRRRRWRWWRRLRPCWRWRRWRSSWPRRRIASRAWRS
jgi:hypothetical protein